MYSNNESSLADKVKRKEPKTRGENQSGTKSRQTNMAVFRISSEGFLPLLNTYGRGEVMFPSFLAAMMRPDECEREADGRRTTTVVITYDGRR